MYEIMQSFHQAKKEAANNHPDSEFRAFCDQVALYRNLVEIPFVVETLIELMLIVQKGEAWFLTATDDEFFKAVDYSIDNLMEEASKLDRFRRELKEMAITLRDRGRQREAEIERHHAERQAEEQTAILIQRDAGKCLARVNSERILVVEGPFEYYRRELRYCKRKATEGDYCKQHYLMRQQDTPPLQE